MTKSSTLKRLSLILISLLLLAALSVMAFSKNLSGSLDVSYKYNLGKALACIATFIALLAFAPLPMEVPGAMKLRIGIITLLSSAIIGFWLWPCFAGATEFDPVIFYTIQSGFPMVLIAVPVCMLLSYVCYLLAFPNGKEMAIVAVPVGLSVAAIRSSGITTLLSRMSDQQELQKLFSLLKFESAFWILLVLSGYTGIWLAEKSIASSAQIEGETTLRKKSPNALLVLAVNLAIAYFGIIILCQNSHIFDSTMRTITLQPTNGQIAFALLISFGLAAFVCKRFLNAGYFYTFMATAILSIAAATLISKGLNDPVYQKLPVYFMSNPLRGIVPVQMVAFGSLGGICGYWYAVLYEKWQRENATLI